MTINQLHYVIAIADEGSLSKAADKLYISQPSLTNQLKELESELGIIIFRRTGRGVTITNDGIEFIQHARQLYGQYEAFMSKYKGGTALKTKFGISTQHYSFAIKAFVEMVKKFDMDEYDFAIRETKTQEVISDVAEMRSELGIIYLSDFNKKAILKVLKQNNLEFIPLVDCNAYAYIWKNHPLVKKEQVSFEDLSAYPNLTFEQSDSSTLYFAEEIFSDIEYRHVIKVNDRATMLNLMQGLLGYTVCSGIICEELNGDECIAVPIVDENIDTREAMHIGYIVQKNSILSSMAERYIRELERYLGILKS